MPKKYRRPWIKLWCDNLLFGTTTKELDPPECWVFIAYLAMAGSSPEPGVLCIAPAVPYTSEQRARVAHVGLDILKSAEHKMLKHNKITIEGDTVTVVNFPQYQAFFNRTEYMRQYMEQRRAKESQQPGTTAGPDVGPSGLLPVVTPGEEKNPLAQILATLTKNYEQEIGLLTAHIASELTDFAQTYHARDAPLNWIDQAFAEAAMHSKRNWAYVKAILTTWINQGKAKSSTTHTEEQIEQEWDEKQKRLRESSAE